MPLQTALVICLIAAGAVPAAACPVMTSADEAAQGLPYAHGRDFETLDGYLAFLKSRGTMGIPYYERLADGRYMCVQRLRPGQEPEIVTRDDLAARFGFSN